MDVNKHPRFARIFARLSEWVAANVVGDDPFPEPASPERVPAQHVGIEGRDD
jgi:hypothetical protein